ncbi:MAG: TIGR02646 family protein [Deltaproteobacteria bacterium]|nr:TIGR02646 family protein [Deltaproteobacteria bacterium]
MAMRRVKKGAEPACLAEVRREVERVESEAGSRLDDRWAQVKDCKLEIQRALIRDQGGLCAYCGGRLTQKKMKVEHFVPRSAEQDLILDWSNLLGCCNGEYREGNKRVLHCDSSRAPYAEGPPGAGAPPHPPGQVPHRPDGALRRQRDRRRKRATTRRNPSHDHRRRARSARVEPQREPVGRKPTARGRAAPSGAEQAIGGGS